MGGPRDLLRALMTNIYEIIKETLKKDSLDKRKRKEIYPKKGFHDLLSLLI
jgi:hypothetical protein